MLDPYGSKPFFRLNEQMLRRGQIIGSTVYLNGQIFSHNDQI